MNEAASNPWPERAVPTDEGKPGAPAKAGEGDPAGEDMRTAPRFTLLIRAARLVCAKGEFVCVIRDVSETGVSVRLFHRLPPGGPYELHMPGGEAYEMRNVWQHDNEAGFEFSRPVDVARLIGEAGQYPKRGLRLDLVFPITVRTLTQQCEGVVENVSQQGARLECDGLFAIDQSLRIEGMDFSGTRREVRAKVRWRRDRRYGVVFDDTFTLGDFARFAAQLQEPALLHE
ncbi:MAG: PilZ domain-containing protein [Erythrobacter sp.]|uniref:PilZ domain-containing protein n=1 Tax=Erythrobacter sp. TaxID=1042 RepID=UPI0032EAFF35